MRVTGAGGPSQSVLNVPWLWGGDGYRRCNFNFQRLVGSSTGCAPRIVSRLLPYLVNLLPALPTWGKPQIQGFVISGRTDAGLTRFSHARRVGVRSGDDGGGAAWVWARSVPCGSWACAACPTVQERRGQARVTTGVIYLGKVWMGMGVGWDVDGTVWLPRLRGSGFQRRSNSGGGSSSSSSSSTRPRDSRCTITRMALSPLFRVAGSGKLRGLAVCPSVRSLSRRYA